MSYRGKRALDVAVAGGVLAARRARARARRAADPARDARPPDLPPAPGRAATGAPFDLYKLRTMVSGAETMGAGLAVDAGDSRITRLGAVLRRTSIDELPNLVNVLRGEMSIVGPRPTVQVQVDRYTERQRGRLDASARADGLGADPGPRLAALARADRARPLVRRARVARARPADPRGGPSAWCSAGDGLYKGETGGWRETARAATSRERHGRLDRFRGSRYCIDTEPPQVNAHSPRQKGVVPCSPSTRRSTPRPSAVATPTPRFPDAAHVARGARRPPRPRRGAPRDRPAVALADRVSPEPVERSRWQSG